MKRTADPAAAGTAAPATNATDATPVQTSAPPGKPPKPAHHLPSARAPRDAYTGKGGSYTRDPATGERTPAAA